MVSTNQFTPKAIDQLAKLNLRDKIGEKSYLKICSALYQDIDLVSVLNRFAREEFNQRNYNATIHIFKAILDFLSDNVEYPDKDSVLLDTIIAFAQIIDCTHNLYTTVKEYLETGLKISIRLNDMRKQILVMLHLGMYYDLARYPQEGYRLFSRGLDMADKLGDRDILMQTEYYRGVFSLSQGYFQQAIAYFERVLFNESLTYFFVPVYEVTLQLYYGYMHAGEYYQAINLMKSSIQHGEESHDYFSVKIYRLHLCWGLLLSGNMNEALEVLRELEEEGGQQYDFTPLPIKRAKAYYWYLQGDYEKAYQLVTEVGIFMDQSNIRRSDYPWFLEVLFCFKIRGFDPIPGYDDYEAYIEELIEGAHLGLRGIAYRIKAKDVLLNKGKPEVIWAYFMNSERDLKAADSRIELAKTRAEMAIFRLKNDDIKSARKLAVSAWLSISLYENLPFPSELLPLINVKSTNYLLTSKQHLNFFKGFLDVLSELTPSESKEAFLRQLLFLCSRFFAADNGCILEFVHKNHSEPLLTNISYNFNVVKTNIEQLDLMFENAKQTYLSQKPNIRTAKDFHGSGNVNQVVNALYIPFGLEDEFAGVLYIGNMFKNSIIGRIDEDILLNLLEYLSKHVDSQWRLFSQSKANCRSAIGRATNSIRVFENPGTFFYGEPSQLTDEANRLASSDASILLLGETGVGKNYLARLLHTFSNRKDMPFIYVNISGLSDALVESELFGHEKGAFTGADKQKPGMIELANKGTLFIDEVGDIPKSIQVKLLHAIEEKTVVRVGGVIPQKIDFRIIAATNHDLVKDVENGDFREDLYYRLSVVPIVIPPLRERENEIIKLAEKFVSYYAKEYRISPPQLSPENKIALQCYHWPGNIRELKNVIEHAVLLSKEDELQLQMPRNPKKAHRSEANQSLQLVGKPTLDELQRQYILQVLNETRGQIGGDNGAAKILGMKRTTLYNRMEKLGIRKNVTSVLQSQGKIKNK